MMSRRTWINLLLFALLCLLAALGWWLQPTPLPPLTDLDPDEINNIRISDNSGRAIRLHKSDGIWRIGQTPADSSRIRQLLEISRTPSFDRFPAPEHQLEAFGLQPSAIRLQLDDLELAFGNNDPINNLRYVQINNLIHRIGDGFQHHLTAPETAWQKK
ncbi:MAG: hypothetical protein JMN24_00205 [gamma proteobacterium endosymbiont of Lamellibrachia anaximandri]|nr:hypothetical protein [gamma proteobacterium endosymbiont of Lamellibrachia anaximandri]